MLASGVPAKRDLKAHKPVMRVIINCTGGGSHSMVGARQMQPTHAVRLYSTAGNHVLQPSTPADAQLSNFDLADVV